MGKVLDGDNPEGGQSERAGLLGGLTQRLQEGVRATLDALIASLRTLRL